MEMETVAVWLSLKEGSEQRWAHQRFLAAGRHLSRPCGRKTHINTFLTAPPLVFTVQLSIKRVSSQGGKNCMSKCIIMGAVTHKERQ